MKKSFEVNIKSELPIEDTIDCHGLSCDDAVYKVDKLLDLYYMYDKPKFTIIHGIGDLKLRTAIREYLETSPYVASYKDGGLFERDPAVTLVELITTRHSNYDLRE